LTERPNGYQKAYYIPVWINTGTYLRELIVDFSFPATLIILYFFGLYISFSWVQFYNGSNLNYLVVLTFLTLILAVSFLMIVTRLADWILSLGFILLVIKVTEIMIRNRVVRELH